MRTAREAKEGKSMSKQRKNTLLHILFSILLAFFLWVFAITNTDPTICLLYTSFAIFIHLAGIVSAKEVKI